ncbi:M16 family metallopeptidase, partial [Nocardiopsis mangrovi]
ADPEAEPRRGDAAGGRAADRPPLPGTRRTPPAGRAGAGPAPMVLADTRVDGRLRVVAVRDDRVPVVELRLRIPLGARVWARPGRDRRLARWLAALLGDRGGAPRGTVLDVSADGEWLNAAGAAPPGRVPEWLAALGSVLAADPGPWPDLPPAGPAGAPDAFSDAVIRALCLAGVATSDAAPARVPGPDGALLVVVGPIDPDGVPPLARTALGPWWALPGGLPAAPDPSGADEPLLVPASGRTAHVTLWAAEDRAGPAEPARHLATAALGGHYASRLVQGAVRRDGKGYMVHAGRDVLLGRPRIFARAAVPADRLAGVAEDMRAVLRGAATEPPTDAEVAAVRDYCTAQLPLAFASPEALADVLAATVSEQRGPRWLTEAGTALREVGPDEVREAAASFAAAEFRTVVLTGDTGERGGDGA